MSMMMSKKAAEMATSEEVPKAAEDISTDTVDADEPHEVETSVNNNRILFIKRPERSKRLTIFESGTELNRIDAVAALATLNMQTVSKRGVSRKVSFSCDLCPQKYASRRNLEKHTSANHSQGSVLLPVSTEYVDKTSLVSELEADVAEAVKISLGAKKKSKEPFSSPPKVQEGLKEASEEEEEEEEELVEVNEKKKEKSRGEAKDPDLVPDPEPNLVTALVKFESFECKHCTALYDNEMKLVKHQSRGHWQKKRFHKYKCDECGATFRFRHNLRQHNQDAHNIHNVQLTYQSPSFKCDICNDTFEYEDALKIHVEYTHVEQVFEQEQHEDQSQNYSSQSDLENGAWVWENAENGLDIGETQIEETESEITKDEEEHVDEEAPQEEEGTPHGELPGDEVQHSKADKTTANEKQSSKLSPKKYKYECKSCDSSFKLWDKLRKHMRNAHSQENDKGKKDQVENNDELQDSRAKPAEAAAKSSSILVHFDVFPQF